MYICKSTLHIYVRMLLRPQLSLSGGPGSPGELPLTFKGWPRYHFPLWSRHGPCRGFSVLRSSAVVTLGSIGLSFGPATWWAWPSASSRKGPLRLLKYKAPPTPPPAPFSCAYHLHGPLSHQTSLQSSKIKLLRISRPRQLSIKQNLGSFEAPCLCDCTSLFPVTPASCTIPWYSGCLRHVFMRRA